MFTFVLIIELLITIIMIGAILLQRSEGGALGMGGGGGGGGLMTSRGAGNALTRLTAFLAAGFFLCSIILAILAKQQADQGLDFTIDTEPATQSVIEPQDETPVLPDGGDALLPPSSDAAADEDVPAAPVTTDADADETVPAGATDEPATDAEAEEENTPQIPE